MDRLSEFCDTTGLKALTWAYKAKSRKEKCFWVVVVLTGLVVATWDVSLTIGRFSQNLTGSKVTVLMNNSFSLGSPTICLYVMLSKELLQHNGLNLANSSEISTFLHDFDDVDLPQFIDERLILLANRTSSEGQTDNLLDHKFVNTVLLISTVLSNVLRVELLNEKFNATEELVWGTIYTLADEEVCTLDNVTSEGIRQTFVYLLARNISLPSLLKNVASGLCYMLEFKVEKTKFSKRAGKKHFKRTNLCLPERMSWFGPEPFFWHNTYDLLCISIENDFINLTSPYDYATFQLNKRIFPEPTDSAGIYLDLTGNNVSTMNDMNVLKIDQGEDTIITVQLLGHFKPLPSSQKPCSKVETRTECRLKYLLDDMHTNCLCTPLFATLLVEQSAKSFPNCQQPANYSTSTVIPGYNATTECVNTSKLTRPGTISARNCLPLCEQRIFNYIHFHNTQPNNSQETQFSVSVDPFMYPLFEEVYLTDPKQFLAQLGGSLSLWLGANFLVLLHSCVFLLKLPFAAKKQAVKVTYNKRLKLMTVKHLEEKFAKQVDERIASVQVQLHRLERLTAETSLLVRQIQQKQPQH